MKEIEATVISILTTEKYVLVECNIILLILKKSHSSFIELYNIIEKYHTYLFVYNSPKLLSLCNEYVIIDIKEPIIHAIIDSVVGFLNIMNEFPRLETHSHEIILKNKNKNKRLLITPIQKKQININKVYVIKFKKAFGINLYSVNDFELTKYDNINLISQ